MLLVKMEEKLLLVKCDRKKLVFSLLLLKAKNLKKASMWPVNRSCLSREVPLTHYLQPAPVLELDVLGGLARTENSNTCIA